MPDLIRGWSPDRFGESGRLDVPWLGATVEVNNWDGADRAYAEACASHLVRLTNGVIDQLVAATARYRAASLEEVGARLPPLAAPRDVLTEVAPLAMSVPVPHDDAPVVHLEANCAWEEEHGLEWVVRGDRVVYVGPYEGVDSWKTYPPGYSYV